MPHKDPHLNTALKVQIHITCAPQVSTTNATTLYNQMVYKIQNHAFDIGILNSHSEDDFLLKVDSNITPSCTYVLRQLLVVNLIKLLP